MYLSAREHGKLKGGQWMPTDSYGKLSSFW